MPMVPVERVEGRRNGGLIGDSHVLRRNRAVTVVDTSTLEALRLRPGDLREQITVSGLPEITNFPRGTRVRAGDLVLRINGPCEPCVHIGKMLGVSDPERLRQHLLGRRGATATVVAVDGALEVGDAIAVEERQPLYVRRRAVPVAAAS
jgi:MOSC domain-containing protein YiiM